jgi:Protein of unknown function (DUF3551)
MTKLSISIFALATALLIADQSALAQRAVYSYPWCLEIGLPGPLSCYYRSYEQCRDEAFQAGGHCTPSPYYRPNQDRLVGKETPRHRRHRPHSQ